MYKPRRSYLGRAIMRRKFILVMTAAAAGLALFWQGWVLYTNCFIAVFVRNEPLVCTDYPTRMQGIALLILAGIAAGIVSQILYQGPRVPLRPFRKASVLIGVVMLAIGCIVLVSSLVQAEAVITEHNASCIGPVNDPGKFQQCVGLTATQRSFRSWAVVGGMVLGVGAALIALGLIVALLPSSPAVGVPTVALGILMAPEAWAWMMGLGYCSPRIVYGGSAACPGALSAIGAIPAGPIVLAFFAGLTIGVGLVLFVLRRRRGQEDTAGSSA